jgi:HCOMODA/2-hydroxy-3-carboxy-muconic semialdehyde decarboxylase
MTASTPSADHATARTELIADLVLANHILYRERVLDGFGHVSARDPDHRDRFLMSRNRAPANVTADDILVYGLDGEPVEPHGEKLYLERYLHSAIYAARPDVNAIVHSHSPAVIPFGITGVGMRPVCHVAGFLGETVPVFEIRDVAGPATDLLIRNQPLGVALAKSLGQRPVVLMRGHGSTAVGSSIPQAVYHAIYTEVNARLQADAVRLGPIEFLTPEEAKATASTNDGVIPRIWDLWKAQAQQPR